MPLLLRGWCICVFCMHVSLLLLVQAPHIVTGMCMHTTRWSECLQQWVACYCSNTGAAAAAGLTAVHAL